MLLVAVSILLVGQSLGQVVNTTGMAVQFPSHVLGFSSFVGRLAHAFPVTGCKSPDCSLADPTRSEKRRARRSARNGLRIVSALVTQGILYNTVKEHTLLDPKWGQSNGRSCKRCSSNLTTATTADLGSILFDC